MTSDKRYARARVVPGHDSPTSHNSHQTCRRWLGLARGLLEQPAAPCYEELPKAFVRAFAQARPALALEEDAAGNLLLKYPARVGQSSGLPREGKRGTPTLLVLLAHLDHPGFWITKATQDQAVLAFKGWIAAGHAHRGCRVRFFTSDSAQPTGSGELAEVTEVRKRLSRAVARITSGVAHSGGFAMWDFPAFALRHGVIVARGCDDELGVALALCVMDEMARRKPQGVAVWALLTRAEEAGFLGALEAIRLETVPKHARVLVLECSKAAGLASQGAGPVVRVGDRETIFDPQLSEALRQAAEELCRKPGGFKYQRKLMDGGACEATPLCAWGYRASGLALPLGNYHNQALTRGSPDIGPETVRVDDFAGGVRLLVALALRPQLLDGSAGKIPQWLKVRAAAARRELARHWHPASFGF
ncbi:MAG: hypothetical protein ABSE73_15290 [Planctomycetota bacterium]